MFRLIIKIWAVMIGLAIILPFVVVFTGLGGEGFIQAGWVIPLLAFSFGLPTLCFLVLIDIIISYIKKYRENRSNNNPKTV